jgi:hypothetical protein
MCTSYEPGAVVLRYDDVYLALQQNAGKDPSDPLNSDYWADIGDLAQIDHNTLAGLQGGTIDERYHVAKDIYDALMAANNPSDTNRFLTSEDQLPHNQLSGIDGYGTYHLAKNEADAAHYATDPSALNPFVTRKEMPKIDVADFRRVHGVPHDVGMLYDAAYGNGLFIAVGEHTAIETRNPRGEWVEAATPKGNYRGICYGLDKFVAVGLRGKAMWRSDQNGGIWYEIGSMPMADWNKIAYGNGVYIAVADGKIATSPDGVNGWAIHTVAPGYGADIVFDNGIFTLVGLSGAATTTDGNTLTPHAVPVGTYRTVTSHEGKIVMLGGKCVVSEDGFATYEEVETPRGGWDVVERGGGFLVALGGGTACMISGVGKVEWEDREALNFAMLGLAFGKDMFVAVGDGVLVAGVVDVPAALRNANAPNGTNPFATIADVEEAKQEAIETAVEQASLYWGGVI